MKHLISTKSLAVAAVALSAFAAVSSVQARSDVYFSVGVQVPGVYVQPVPVYVQPRQPVYVQPRLPVYVQPRQPVYVQPRQFYAPAPIFYAPAPTYYQRYDNGRRYGAQNWQHREPNWDRGRQGNRNQYDRDHDGDGARNRYDRVQNHPSRR